MTQQAFKEHFDSYRMSIHKEGPFRKRTKNIKWSLSLWLAQEWPLELQNIVKQILNRSNPIL